MFYFDKPKITHVFEYRRQSLDEKDVRQTHSLPLQAQFNDEFADRFGLKIVDRFIDDASAKIPDNRPQFTKMLKELGYRDPKKRRADGILAWHPDRLARNGLEAGKVVQMISDELIKDMFFPTYHFHNDPSGIEHLMMEFGRAISYSGWLSINSKRGSTGREQKGAWVYGRSKFGYTKLREVPESPKLCSLFPIPDARTFPAKQRLVELWKGGVSDEECSRIIKRKFGLTLGRSSVSTMRRDPFNYGVYVIKPGDEKDERRIDYRELTAPDGRAFEPVTDEETYWSFQTFRRKEQPTRRKTRHVNPLQGQVICGHCDNRMRPARRKIRRKGFTTIKELGYECHTQSCTQSRIRGAVLFDALASEIEAAFSAVDRRTWHQYLIGLRSFLAEKTRTGKIARSKLTRRITALEKEKSDVIDKRLSAIRAYQYDDDTKAWCKTRLSEIERDLRDLKKEASEQAADGHARAATFTKLIELRASLHRLWLAADDGQKKRIGEKAVLNLTVEGSEIRSVSWTTPAQAYKKSPEKGCGGGSRQPVEPTLDTLWTWLFLSNRPAEISAREGFLSLADLIDCLGDDAFRVPSDAGDIAAAT